MLLMPTNCLNREAVILESQIFDKVLKEIFQIHQAKLLYHNTEFKLRTKAVKG